MSIEQNPHTRIYIPIQILNYNQFPSRKPVKGTPPTHPNMSEHDKNVIIEKLQLTDT